MDDFNKEHMLITYAVLQDMRAEEITAREDYRERLETRGSRGFHTDYDAVLWNLEAEAHQHGFFFWHHFEGDNDESSIYTIEEIKPTGTFDIVQAETRFNEIQRMGKEAGPFIQEQGEISHEAHRNGLEFTWSNGQGRYACTQLPMPGVVAKPSW